MDLTDRKKQILKVVIEDYIRTAEPVGSKTIAKEMGGSVSSATIRNELADLTEQGYLEQPHTSAGRIPSPQGYRLYVNDLGGIVCCVRTQRFRPHNFALKAKKSS